MDRFDTIQAFIRVVETGSFTQAALTLQTSRTRVTQLVQRLESRLEARLLNRTTRQVKLTPDGVVYYQRVVPLMAELHAAEASLASALSAPQGRLRVDVPSPFANRILLPALAQFQTRYPGIQLHLGVSDRTVDIIDEQVDCVVRGGTITQQGLVARHLGDLEMSLYASPRYLSQTGLPRHPRELEEEPHQLVGFFWREAQGAYPNSLARHGERVQIRGKTPLMVDDGNAYFAAGLDGLGVVCLPTIMARTHVVQGELTPLFPDWRLEPLPLYLAYLPNRHVSAKLRAFMDWLATLTQQYLAQPQRGSPLRRED